MVLHDTKCPYWNQMSLNNINLLNADDLVTAVFHLCVLIIVLTVSNNVFINVCSSVCLSVSLLVYLMLIDFWDKLDEM